VPSQQPTARASDVLCCVVFHCNVHTGADLSIANCCSNKTYVLPNLVFLMIKTKENGGKMLLVQVSGCTQQTCLWYNQAHLENSQSIYKESDWKRSGHSWAMRRDSEGIQQCIVSKGILGVLLLSQGNQDWKQRSCTRHTNMLTCWLPDLLQMEICPLYIPRARCCPSAVHAAHNTCWCPPTMW
jgi:hypothetical protein